jgi:uncharacterized protein
MAKRLLLEGDGGWALVTGASGGIGARLAGLLAGSGWRLALAGRNGERLESVRAGLEGPFAAEAVAIRADLSVPRAASRLHRECAERGIEVSLLANNAGWGLFGEGVALDAAAVESMVALNVSTLTSLCGLFGRDMKARGRGRILNVGSLAGLKPMPYFAAYSASKSYVLSYSLALRAELALYGVSVSCLLPGYVRTGFDEAAGIASERYRAFSYKNAMEPEDVARCGLRLLERDRAWGIAGARNRAAAFFLGFLPKAAAPALMRGFIAHLAFGGARR